MIYPCYGCAVRFPGCHSRCEAYRQASKAQEEATEARKQARSACQFVWDVGGRDRKRRRGKIYKFRIAEKGRKGKCSVTALTIMRFHYPEV